MERFLQHRIADRRILRLIHKRLKAGVVEDGQWKASEKGSPQGASISPLLANVYLHYVLDLWAQQWRRRYARGDVIIVRWADDFVVGFQYEDDARRFKGELQDRFERFSLELHPEKTRLIRFGRFAARDLRLPWLYPLLWNKPQREVPGLSYHQAKEAYCQTPRGKSRAPETYAPVHSCPGELAKVGS